MSSHLNRLLGGENRQQRALIDLQRMTRDDSDVRLLADVLARAHSILRALGLDPRDTTGEEVYRALMAVAPRVRKRPVSRLVIGCWLSLTGRLFHSIQLISLRIIITSCHLANIRRRTARRVWVTKSHAVTRIMLARITLRLRELCAMAVFAGLSEISDRSKFCWRLLVR